MAVVADASAIFGYHDPFSVSSVSYLYIVLEKCVAFYVQISEPLVNYFLSNSLPSISKPSPA